MNSKIIENIVWLILGFIYLITVRYENTVVFLDVGQGDAILIQDGSTQILVDGGPDDSVLYQLQKYIPMYDRRIEYVILTHPHNDHLVGLLKVLERYEVGEVLYYPVCYDNENYEYLLQEDLNFEKVGKGDTISLNTFDINILWPVLDDSAQGCIKPFDGNINNDSLVLEFEYLKKEFLLMGDLESDAERVLVQEGAMTKQYDVFKAGHHCSASSSSETFIKVVSPYVAICSLSRDNSFGHPSSETLKIFSTFNVQYLITAQEGNIQIK